MSRKNRNQKSQKLGASTTDSQASSQNLASAPSMPAPSNPATHVETTSSKNALSVEGEQPFETVATESRPGRKARRCMNKRVNAAVMNSSVPGYQPVVIGVAGNLGTNRAEQVQERVVELVTATPRTPPHNITLLTIAPALAPAGTNHSNSNGRYRGGMGNPAIYGQRYQRNNNNPNNGCRPSRTTPPGGRTDLGNNNNVLSPRNDFSRKNTQQGQVGGPMLVAAGIPTTFRPFSRLPKELQIKVVEKACEEERLIELEYGPSKGQPLGPYTSPHDRRQVCAASRAPPAVLQVNKLFRDAALDAYQLRTFDNGPIELRRKIYFNPQADIIYFGENSCVATLLWLFQSGSNIPRVAINCSAKMECCTDKLDDYTYFIDGGINIMQVLHGFDRSICPHTDWSVDVGLTDVYYIIKSNLWRVNKMHSGIEMRNPTNKGLTSGQVNFKAVSEARIARVVDGRGVYGVGENKWVGDMKPNFHFASFCPKTTGVDHPRVYDGMCVPRNQINRLRSYDERRGDYCKFNDLKSIKYFAKKFGVEITIPEPVYPQEDPREIGFFGTKEAIGKAKAAIKERTESGPPANVRR